VIGGAGADPDRVHVIELATGDERVLGAADLLAEPARYFAIFGEARHA